MTLAMLLLDVVAAGVQYRAMVRERIRAAEFFCDVVRTARDAGEWEGTAAAVMLQKLSAAAGAESVALAERGAVVFSRFPSPAADVAPLALAVAKSGMARPELSGRLWWIFFPGAARVRYGVPFAGGAVAVSFSLVPGLSTVIAGQRLLLVYLLVNLALFLLISNYRIERLLFRPLRRLVSRAEDIGVEDEFMPLPGQQHGEFNRLSRALNNMLRRLNADREALARTVASLEEANRTLRKAQKEMVQAEKLAAIGRLSAGIAHEIGNPVGIISGYLDLLEQDSIPAGTRRDYVARAREEAARINRIVTQLLDFSRERDEGETLFRVSAVASAVVDACASLPLTSRVPVRLVTGGGDDTVAGSPTLFEQVLMNLVINSVDAIRDAGMPPEEGRVTIEVETDDRNDGGVVTVRVRDNGPGIATQELDKVFDPFFTTKEPGRGTGLGLFIAYSVTGRMGGRITVANSGEGGAVFTIELPRHGQAEGNDARE